MIRDELSLIVRKIELESNLEEMIREQRPKKEWLHIIRELTTVRLELNEI